jgi:hypothetical protein
MRRESFKRNLAFEKAVPIGLLDNRASSGAEEEENIFINSSRQDSSQNGTAPKVLQEARRMLREARRQPS